MGSSNTIEPWMLRSGGDSSWYPDAFARETESALTKALQQSFFNHQSQTHQNFVVNTNTNTNINTASASTVTVSGSGSEPETPGSKRRDHLGVSIGKTAKRKSRASKRSMTTFIQADPANFRQMVQQVTGVKFQGNQQLPVMKPEPLRQPFMNKLQGLLPTLDTSAYLLHHHQNNTHVSQPPAMNLVAGDGMDFYSFSSFPTLESSI